ncbi:hypothetical protein PX554_20180 [Sphingomonas sp. H39-1-10]|uniref:hypothetical protein n=1 Tax=Sphingomonas pollutisoli TaxID=3030829 RepID=UPI0023B8EFA4|nr:hypothetical protein [Sphingomonas pollutisoli]MDF0490452.1 hypothetical protein [Sphingomonas pollutisoli]
MPVTTRTIDYTVPSHADDPDAMIKAHIRGLFEALGGACEGAAGELGSAFALGGEGLRGLSPDIHEWFANLVRSSRQQADDRQGELPLS